MSFDDEWNRLVRAAAERQSTGTRLNQVETGGGGGSSTPQGELTVAQKDLAALAKRMEGSKAEQPDPKAQAEVEGIAKKHGFKDFTEYDEVGSNIDMILAAIDPDTKKFVPPEEAIRKEIDSVKSDKSLSETERTKLLEEFNDSLKTVPAIQHKGNIGLIESYFDRLVAVLQ